MVNQFNDRTSIDGRLPGKGEVLVPVWIQKGYRLPKENRKYLETFRFGNYKFPVGFIPIPAECFRSYMESFYSEINKDLAKHRKGRCVIGHKSNGECICCPKVRRCSGCAERDSHERYNPQRDRFKVCSLEVLFEDDEFDFPDANALLPEEYMITREEISEEECYEHILSHFEAVNPRYAAIIRLCRQGATPEEIFEEICVSPSRGYEEINNAYNALCDLLQLSAYKKKKKSRRNGGVRRG